VSAAGLAHITICINARSEKQQPRFDGVFCAVYIHNYPLRSGRSCIPEWRRGLPRARQISAPNPYVNRRRGQCLIACACDTRVSRRDKARVAATAALYPNDKCAQVLTLGAAASAEL
jgi:hypothetical protein